jgi:hypothetical protein
MPTAFGSLTSWCIFFFLVFINQTGSIVIFTSSKPGGTIKLLGLACPKPPRPLCADPAGSKGYRAATAYQLFRWHELDSIFARRMGIGQDFL